MIQNFLSFLNNNSNLVIAIATVIYVILTLIIIRSNNQVFKLMCKKYEEEWRPYIHIKTISRSSFLAILSITNCGKTIAHNVKFGIDKDFHLLGNSAKGKIKDLNIFKNGIKQFIPGQEYLINLGTYPQIFSEGNTLPMSFTIKCTYTYEDTDYEEETLIDFEPELNTSLKIDPIAEKIENLNKIIEKVENHLKKIIMGNRL